MAVTEAVIIERLCAEIERQHMSGRQLAAAVGKPNTTVRRVLAGAQPLTVGDLIAISRALGKAPAEIEPGLARGNPRTRGAANSPEVLAMPVDALLAVAAGGQVSAASLVKGLA